MILEATLNSGRTVGLTQMFLSETYLGLIEGRPTIESKKTVLGWHGSVSGAVWPGVPVVVLGLADYLADSSPELPRFRFLGAFESYGYVHDKQKWGSRLVCVWYQDETHPSISRQNMQLLLQIEWNKIADDFDPI